MIGSIARGSKAPVFVLALILLAAQPSPAAAEIQEPAVSPAGARCIVGYRFWPGPIVDGRNRQPTVREFEARMQELKDLEQRDAERCGGSMPGRKVIVTPSPAG